MPSVKIRENEPFDIALSRFKRSCEKAGILAEVRRREYYEKPTEENYQKLQEQLQNIYHQLCHDPIHKSLQNSLKYWGMPPSLDICHSPRFHFI